VQLVPETLLHPDHDLKIVDLLLQSADSIGNRIAGCRGRRGIGSGSFGRHGRRILLGKDRRRAGNAQKHGSRQCCSQARSPALS
jgi:hypothetical protein